MVRLRVLDILKEQNHSKYWLYKQMELSYQNFNRMVQNALRRYSDDEIMRAIEKAERDGICDYRYRACCNEARRRGL